MANKFTIINEKFESKKINKQDFYHIKTEEKDGT